MKHPHHLLKCNCIFIMHWKLRVWWLKHIGIGCKRCIYIYICMLFVMHGFHHRGINSLLVANLETLGYEFDSPPWEVLPKTKSSENQCHVCAHSHEPQAKEWTWCITICMWYYHWVAFSKPLFDLLHTLERALSWNPCFPRENCQFVF